jgi:LmbE family N-acetylglucosaminyl deacetylase
MERSTRTVIELALNRDAKAPWRILCLGAHSDDLEIGCGATILRLAREYPSTSFHWVVFSTGDDDRRREATAAANAFLDGANSKQVEIESFRDGFFPFLGERIKERFEEIKAAFVPDLVFTHHRHDLHQDHRTIAELTWQTFRDSMILEYEIPKWDGDLGTPNCYVRVPDALADRKIELIMAHFRSQHAKRWFTPDTFRALMRLRGIEAGTALAEAFYARKLTVG